MKDITNLFLSALRDWPDDSQDIFAAIQAFKLFFGNPLTIQNTAHYNGRKTEYWTWRVESGKSLSEMIAIASKKCHISDFDAIIDAMLTHYERKFLLNTKQKPFKDTGYAYFSIHSTHLTVENLVTKFGIEPDHFDTLKTDHWTISTPLSINTNQSTMIRQIVKRLIPIKDQLIAFKRAYPDSHYELQVVIWSRYIDLSLSNETLLFLGEIGAALESEIFAI